MKDLDFLNKLKKERKLELVEMSEQMSASYEKKSQESGQVAKLAFENKYFESTIIQGYYSMYNSVLSLFFKCGIKCENHSASAILLKNLFHLDKLGVIFQKAKEERIDKQYYITPKQENPASKESSQNMIAIASRFVLEMDAFKNNLKLEEINKIRKDFGKL